MSAYKFNDPDGIDSVIFMVVVMDQKMDYIHNNPAESRMVDEPTAYMHSSARDYAGQKGLLSIEFIE